jgi:hypothetical protein
MLASTVQFSRYGRFRPRAQRLSASADGSLWGRPAPAQPVPVRCERIARSLRTQQRARPPSHSLQRFHSGRPEVLAELGDDGQLVDVPPLSNHPGTNVQVVALDADGSAPGAP